MENKILVADDSPTIQKVINITLANKDLELDAAQSEDELYEKLASKTYALVLLDYNLSDTSAGTDLVKYIKEKSPATFVLAMLGTFDSVEESILEDAGFSDKIVKPFESSKFIQKIEFLLSGTDEGEGDSLDENIFDTTSSNGPNDDEEEQGGSESLDTDDWSIDGPGVIEQESFSDIESENESSDTDPLVAEVAGWGMSVPEVIGAGGEDHSILPPFIEATEVVFNSSQNENQNNKGEFFSLEDQADEHQTREIQIPDELKALSNFEEEAPSFPEATDLNYPDMSSADEDGGESDEVSNDRPQLTSLDELESFDEDDDNDNEDLDTTDPQIMIEPNGDSPDLVNAINDDISPDDFWAVDFEEEVQGIGVVSDEDVHEQELMGLEDEIEDDDDFSIDEHPSTEGPAKTNELSDIGPKLEKVDYQSLAEQIKMELLNELRPLIKDMVKDALDTANGDAVEKVAWEVIPDLAENLIRKEVKELSQRVMEKHSLS